jgi:hypothetical protein
MPLEDVIDINRVLPGCPAGACSVRITTTMMRFITILALAAVASAGRVFPEADVKTFSSKFWSSEKIAADNDVVKVTKRFFRPC